MLVNSFLNSKQLLRKLQKILGEYFIAAPRKPMEKYTYVQSIV